MSFDTFLSVGVPMTAEEFLLAKKALAPFEGSVGGDRAGYFMGELEFSHGSGHGCPSPRTILTHLQEALGRPLEGILYYDNESGQYVWLWAGAYEPAEFMVDSLTGDYEDASDRVEVVRGERWSYAVLHHNDPETWGPSTVDVGWLGLADLW